MTTVTCAVVMHLLFMGLQGECSLGSWVFNKVHFTEETPWSALFTGQLSTRTGKNKNARLPVVHVEDSPCVSFAASQTFSLVGEEEYLFVAVSLIPAVICLFPLYNLGSLQKYFLKVNKKTIFQSPWFILAFSASGSRTVLDSGQGVWLCLALAGFASALSVLFTFI